MIHLQGPSPRCARALAACFIVAACGQDDTVPTVAGVIDRETFIEVYVDLRAETVLGDELALTREQRDGILARHGVDAESLVAFVEAYGRELNYMNELWSEVERRLEARPPASPDTTAGGRTL